MRPVFFVLTLASLIWGGGVGAADEVVEFYLESPGVAVRNDAALVQQVAAEQGWQARIVRRYGQGEGWAYFVLIEGFTEQAAAESAASVLAAATKQEIEVYRREGRAGTLLGTGAARGGMEVDDMERGSVSKDLPASDEILERAVRAVGGREAGLPKLEAVDNLTFRYERTLQRPDGAIVAAHAYLRTPTQARLDVRIVSGPGVSSTTIVHADKAWLIANGETLARDPGKSKEILAEFGPEHLLSYPLRFATLVASDPAHGRLVTTDSLRVNGHGGYLLEYAGPEVGGALSVLIDGETWYPVEVTSTSDAGLVRVRFADWRALDAGVIVPFEVTMERDGQVIEVLKVLELEAPTTVEAARFDPATAAPAAP